MNKRICIIEDDPDLLEAICACLEDTGFDVVGTTKSSEIQTEVNNIASHPISLFIIDLFLSKENGKDVSLNLKSNPKSKDIPILLVSATLDIEKHAKLAKADDFLSKPFDIDELSKKINVMLNSQNNSN